MLTIFVINGVNLSLVSIRPFGAKAIGFADFEPADNYKT